MKAALVLCTLHYKNAQPQFTSDSYSASTVRMSNFSDYLFAFHWDFRSLVIISWPKAMEWLTLEFIIRSYVLHLHVIVIVDLILDSRQQNIIVHILYIL